MKNSDQKKYNLQYALVYCDFPNNEIRYHIKILGISDTRFSHGLSLYQTFTNEIEAYEYAKLVDNHIKEYFDLDEESNEKV